MGWKISALIIKGEYHNQVTDLTTELGLGKSEISDRISLNEALYPDLFCVGFYNKCTIVTHASILNAFFNSTPSKIENRFCSIFSLTQIMALGQIETAGINGFSFIDHGQRVRTWLQGEEEGIIIDTGTPLREEKDIDVYDRVFVLPKILLGIRLDAEELLNTLMFKLKSSGI